MERRRLKCGGRINRPKAWLGAVLGAAGSIVSSIAQADAAEKAAEEQKRMQEHKDAITRAQSLTEAFNLTKNAQKEYEDRFRINYKNGGKRKLRNDVKITDGGYAIPISNDTVLLRGSSHEDINETGQTGIGLKIGKKEIEAEGGEVLQKTPNEVRIFSNSLLLPNGMTPAEAVESGINKNYVFNIQQDMNGNYGTKGKRKLRNRGMKAALGASFDTADWIGLGVNSLGSLASMLVNKRAADNIKDPIAPIAVSPGKFITNYNIAPRLSELKNTRFNMLKDSDETISSAGRIARRNQINLLSNQEANKLWEEKTNKEIELLNKDTENQQNVHERNVQNLNQYYDKLIDMANRREVAKAQAIIEGIQGLGSSVGAFLQSGIDKYQADQARRMQLAASPYGSAERASQFGVDFSRPMMSTFRNDAESRLGKYANDNTESGIKSYNDALDSYNYWAGLLGGPSNSYTRRSLSSPTVKLSTNRNVSLSRPIVNDIDDGYAYERRRRSR